MTFNNMTRGEHRVIETTGDDSRVESDPNTDLQRSAAVYMRARVFHELRGELTSSPAEQVSDKERICCLEAIIAVLIEKNEKIRQQLWQGMS